MNSKSPTAALILIGDELLSGRTPDENLNYFACEMTRIGVAFAEARVVADDEPVIINTLNELRRKYTYVFTTGGIGPTHDDITVDCVAKAFGVPVVRDEATEKAFKAHFGKDLKQATLKMADIPKGASLVENEISIAPGFCMENVFVLAGVPNIMRAMLSSIIPTLKKGDVVISRSVEVNIGESAISDDLSAVQELFKGAVSVGSYPYEGRVGTSLVVRSSDKSQLDNAFEAILTFLDKLGVEYRV